MPSATYALLWEIWRRNRVAIVAIAGMTVAGRLLNASERASGSVEPSSLVELLRMAAFVLVFGIFNYTESVDGRGLGYFPRRLFTLPVSSLRLVAIPALAGVAAVELLHLSWLGTLSNGSSMNPWFVAVLLGATLMCYQAVLWTLERLGTLRLAAQGGVVFGAFAVGLLPSFAPSPPPAWRSEAALATMVGALSGMVFLLEWGYIARQRHGGPRRVPGFVSALPSAFASSGARTPFASPAAAHFWFEWRTAGVVLPTLVAVVLGAVFGPLTWLDRHDAGPSLRLLFGTLALPVVLAIPIGMAFARPAFWLDELSVPPFVAVRPLTDEDIVAIKIRVAAASAGVSWLLVLTFLGVWLSLWRNVDGLSQLAMQWRALHEQSHAAVYGMVVLILVAGMLLTWRFLIVRFASGMSGRTWLFTASVLSVLMVVIAWMVFDGTRLPDWVLADPAHMAVAVWILSIATLAKFGMAAYSWRRVSRRYAWRYAVLWAAGTACLVMLAVRLWSVIRLDVAPDVSRIRALMLLLALLVVPLGRMGLAPSLLARNRHR